MFVKGRGDGAGETKVALFILVRADYAIAMAVYSGHVEAIGEAKGPFERTSDLRQPELEVPSLVFRIYYHSKFISAVCGSRWR